jgi:hypothetical protein
MLRIAKLKPLEASRPQMCGRGNGDVETNLRRRCRVVFHARVIISQTVERVARVRNSERKGVVAANLPDVVLRTVQKCRRRGRGFAKVREKGTKTAANAGWAQVK